MCTMDKFLVETTFANFENFARICSNAVASNPDQKDEFWISWTIFNKTYKSDEFTSQTRPTAFKEMSSHLMEQDMESLERQENFNLKVFLCTENNMLAGGMVNPISDHHSDQFPFHVSKIVPLVPFAESHSSQDVALIHMNFHIERIPQPISNKASSDEDEYADDAFEDEGANIPKSVHFGETESEARLLEMIDRSDAIKEEENCNRLFRVVVNIKRIGGLKRAAHVYVHFVYPYLGSTASISSRPMWLTANSESNIDNGVAIFKCTKSRIQLRDVFNRHPCKILVNSKTASGTEELGTVEVDLESVFKADPHLYRCPRTGREFKTLSEYSIYRLQQRQKGRELPKEPVILRAAESVLRLKPARDETKCSVLVMVAIEDIGVVGLLSAEAVPKGYKQAGGALYYTDEADAEATGTDRPESQLETAGEGAAAAGEAALSLLDQVRELEQRKLEWERFRQDAEAKWREDLHAKEIALRKQIELECNAQIAHKSDALRRAQEELNKQEVRLKNEIHLVEKERIDAALSETQRRTMHEQKLNELRSMEHRIREESKAAVDRERRVAAQLRDQVASLEEQLKKSNARATALENEYDSYRTKMRSMPESVLREKNATLQAQLAEARSEIERQRRIVAERDLEIDQQKKTIQRVASALKQQREKSSAIARQEMEQLRMEFLAREERYMHCWLFDF